MCNKSQMCIWIFIPSSFQPGTDWAQKPVGIQTTHRAAFSEAIASLATVDKLSSRNPKQFQQIPATFISNLCRKSFQKCIAEGIEKYCQQFTQLRVREEDV